MLGRPLIRKPWHLIFTLVLVGGCGGSSTSSTSSSGSSTSPTSPSATSSASSLTANIDGVQFSAVSTVVVKTNVAISVSGTTNPAVSPFTELAIGVPPTVGTYAIGAVPLGSPLNLSNGTVQVIGGAAGAAQWTADSFNGSGTVTLATLTSTGATGTFSFTAVPLKNTAATGTKVVTNGAFNVKF